MTPTIRTGPKFYLDTEDTISEVGITRRQLSYWQQEGLLTPEFGAGAKKFTEPDIRRLRVLRRLIVEQGLPFSFVKQIVEGETEFAASFVRDLIESGALLSKNPEGLSHKVLDFDRGGLVAATAFAEETWTAKQSVASEENIQEQLYVIALLLFRTILATQRHPVAYQERRDKILDQIRVLSDIARTSWHFRERDGKLMAYFTFAPGLSDSVDQEYGFYDVWLEFIHYAQRLEPFAQAAEELAGHLDVPRDVMKRFWERGLAMKVASAEEYVARATEDGNGSMEDVPF